MKDKIRKKFKKVEMLFMDVDGVLTDGSAFFINGISPKRWNVKDRMAVNLITSLKTEDIKVAWISGRLSKNLKKRAEELGVVEAHSNIKNKITLMRKICDRYNIKPENSLYIGDDLVDLGCMAAAGVSCCPEDAVAEVKERVDYIAGKPGGRGAVREIVEKVLKAKGYWRKIVDSYTEI
ncbi:MAG: KdsC family phosphatase [Elusimicrobiota bacterium]